MPLDEETKKEVIEKIKELPAEKKTKCVGLYKLLNEVYNADNLFSSNGNKIAFSSHQKLRQIYNSAFDIMKGHTQFVPESVADLAEFFTAEELASEAFKNAAPFADASNTLWADVLTKVGFLEHRITDQDKEILKSLDHVEVFLSEDNSDFKIEFSFKANDYFTNDKLVLEVATDEEGNVEEVKSTEVAWKAGKNVTVAETQKKQKNKKSGQVRMQTKTERQESFFWLFKNHLPPNEDEEDEENDDFNVDPLSDSELFHNAADIVLFFKESFFTFMIPAVYGVEIKPFAADFMDDEGCDGGEGHDHPHPHPKGKGAGDNAKGQNPQCKQQ